MALLTSAGARLVRGRLLSTPLSEMRINIISHKKKLSFLIYTTLYIKYTFCKQIEDQQSLAGSELALAKNTKFAYIVNLIK